MSQIVRRIRAIPGAVVRKRHGTAFGMAGDPDLYGCINGRHFEIEVKRPGERPTPLQEARITAWDAAGAMCGVAHSADEAMRILGQIDGRRETGTWASGNPPAGRA